MYPYNPGTYSIPADININTSPVNTGADDTELNSMLVYAARSGGNAARGAQARQVPTYEDISYFDVENTPQEEKPERGEFIKGVLRGTDETQATAYGIIGVLGDILGSDSVRDWGYAGYQKNMKEAEENPAATGSVFDIDSVGSLKDYAAGTLGTLTAQVPYALFSGGVGSAIGKTLAGKAVQTYAANTIKEQAGQLLVSQGIKEATKEQADKALAMATNSFISKLAARGAALGIGANTTIQEAGSNWGQDVESHGIENTNPGQDFMFGLASGVVDSIMGADISLFRALTGKTVSKATEMKFRDVLTKSLPKAMAEEGSAEAIQEVLSSINANIQDAKGLITEDDIKGIVDAAVAGALGGGAFHVPTLMKSIGNRNKLTSDEKKLQSLGDEIVQNQVEQVSEEIDKTTQDITEATQAKEQTSAIDAETSAFNNYWDDITDNYLKAKRAGKSNEEWLALAPRFEYLSDTDKRNITNAQKALGKLQEQRHIAELKLLKWMNSQTKRVGEIRNPLFDEDTNNTTNLIPKDEQVYLAQQEQGAWEAGRQVAQRQYDIWNKYAEEERAQFSKEWDTKNKGIIDEYNKWRQIQTQNGRLLPEQQKEAAKSVAAYAEYQSSRKEAEKELEKKLARGYTTPTGELISAAKLQANAEYQKSLVDQGVKDGLYNDIGARLQDTVVYSNKLQKILDNRLNTIQEAINNTTAKLDGEQKNLTLTPASFKRYKKHIQGLQRELGRTNKAKRKMSKMLGDITRKSQQLTGENLGTIGADIQDLFNTGQEILNLEGINDVYRAEQDLAISNAKDRLNKLKTELNKVNTSINNLDDTKYNTFKNIAKGIINNTKSSLNNINIDTDYNLRDVKDQNVNPEAQETSKLQSDAATLDNKSALDRAFAITKMQSLKDSLYTAEQMNKILNENNIRKNTGQKNVTPPNSDTVSRLQEADRGTKTQNPTQQSGQQQNVPTAPQIQSAEGAQQQAAKELETKQDITTSAQQSPIIKKVAEYTQNILNNLPALKDNVLIVEDGNSPSVPLEIQNLLTKVQGSPKGAYWNGKVYIFASNIVNKQDAVRTVVHEGVAHYGLRSLFNDAQLAHFIGITYDSFKDTPEWNRFLDNRPEVTNQKPLTQAEEFVAYIAEQMKASQLTRPGIKAIFNRIIGFLRNVLRTLGFGDKLTVDDIRDVINLSAKNLTNQRTKVRDALNEVVISTDKDIQSYDVPNEPIYGTKFDSAEDAIKAYKNTEYSRSGVPNTAYIQNYPKNSNTLNLNDTLQQQPQPVQARLSKLIDRLGIKPEAVQREDGSQVISFMGKQFNPDASLTENFILDNITGWDVYSTLAQMTDKRQATAMLRAYGIRGAQYAQDGKNNYYLFEGNNLSERPYVYSLSVLSEPKFLVTEATPRDEIVLDPETGEPTGKTTEDNVTYMNTLFSNTNAQSRWIRYLDEFKKTGKTTDANGNLIEHGFIEKFIEAGVDQFRRLKVIQQYLKEKGSKALNFTTNLYQNLQTLSNEIKNEQSNQLNKYYRSALDVLKTVDSDMPFFDEKGNQVQTIKADGSETYINAKLKALDILLLARHAPERNASVNARMRGVRYTDKKGNVHYRNAKTPDKGGTIINASGMPDSQARMLVAKYETIPGLKEAADKVSAMNKFTLDSMLDYGLIDKDSYTKMAEYDYYVPLRGWEDMINVFDPGAYRSKGSLSTGNKKIAQYSKGRTGLPESPFLRSVQQMEDIIAVGKRNQVMRGFGELVKATQDEKNLWEIDRTGTGAVRLQIMPDGSIGFRAKPSELSGEGYKFVTYFDENGKQVRIAIKDKWLANALRGENRPVQGAVIDGFRKVTGLMAQFMTSRNPAFACSNPVRDLPSSILNLGSVIEENEKRGLMEKGGHIQRTVFTEVTSGKYAKLLWDLASSDEGRTTFDPSKYNPEMVKDLEDWRRYGGHTRSLDLYSIQDLYKDARKNLRTKGINKVFGSLLSYCDILADTTENMTRFAVYRNVQKAFVDNINTRAQQEGWTPDKVRTEIENAKQKSANIALDCTVNFSKRGAWADVYNPLWAFSSATFQSFYRIARNLWRPTSTPAQNFARVSKFIAFGVGFPLMWGTICRSIMGDDRDGKNKYDKIPNYVKLGNLIIPSPFGDGEYIKIPLPYGYNVFTAMGIAVDNVTNGNCGVATAAKDVLSTAISGVSPINPMDGLTQLFPTVLKPIVEIAANKSFTGTPIVPEGYAVENLPNYLKAWSKTPQVYKDAAAFMNFLTGGFMTKDGVGLLDMSPEIYEHLVTSYLGGLGRTLQQAADLIVSPAFNYDVPTKSIPILNRFYGTVGYDNDNSIYHTYDNQVSAALALKKQYEEDPEKLKEIRETYATELSLEKVHKSVTKELNKIREAENKLKKKYPQGTRSSAYNNQMKLIEKRKQQIMQRFNRQANARGLASQE